MLLQITFGVELLRAVRAFDEHQVVMSDEMEVQSVLGGEELVGTAVVRAAMLLDVQMDRPHVSFEIRPELCFPIVALIAEVQRSGLAVELRDVPVERIFFVERGGTNRTQEDVVLDDVRLGVPLGRQRRLADPIADAAAVDRRVYVVDVLVLAFDHVERRVAQEAAEVALRWFPELALLLALHHLRCPPNSLHSYNAVKDLFVTGRFLDFLAVA